MKKSKRLSLITKKEQLMLKLIPILEKFTDSTGLVVTNISCEHGVEPIYNAADQEIGTKTIYTLNTDIEL